MADGKLGTIDAAGQVIVLAFELVDSTLPDTPSLLAQALQSPQVQDSIKTTLIGFAKLKAKTNTTVVSDEESRKLLETLGTGIKDAASQQVLEQIKKTPQYKRLEGGVAAFQKAAASSSLGVWIDKNKGILYVVGAALVAGTATVLYITKTSAMPINKAVEALKGKEFEILQIGTLNFKAALWDFKPDARILGARVITTKQWEKVSLEVKLGILAEGAQVQQVEGEALVKSGAFNLQVTGAGKPQVQQVNLGLKLGYTGVIDNGTFNVGVGAMYQDQQVSGTVGASYKTGKTTFGLEGNVGGKDGGVQYGGLLTVSVDL